MAQYSRRAGSFLDPRRTRTWVAGILLLVIGFYAWALADIQLRLWRNGAIAHEVLEALSSRFPDARFRGAAAYDVEEVYIILVGGLDRIDQREVEAYLRGVKAERRIAPLILLKFVDDANKETAIHI